MECSMPYHADVSEPDPSQSIISKYWPDPPVSDGPGSGIQPLTHTHTHTHHMCIHNSHSQTQVWHCSHPAWTHTFLRAVTHISSTHTHTHTHTPPPTHPHHTTPHPHTPPPPTPPPPPQPQTKTPPSEW